jgi:hypothetical protein
MLLIGCNGKDDDDDGNGTSYVGGRAGGEMQWTYGGSKNGHLNGAYKISA